MMNETRPGQRTTEFFITIASIIGVIAAALSDVVPAEYAAVLATVATVAYAISRGVAKHGIPANAVREDQFREDGESADVGIERYTATGLSVPKSD